MGSMNRRTFLKGTVGVAAAAASISIGGTKAGGKIIGANDRFRIAVAGVHGRGGDHVKGWTGLPNVEVAYLIDPDSKVLDGAVAGLMKRLAQDKLGKLAIEGKKPQDLTDEDKKALEERKQAEKKIADELTEGFKGRAVADVRKALEDKDLDAISIATPNHWHSLMTIWGAQAGKNVYVEKPASHDVYEGRVDVQAQKKYGVVIQHGTQRRSSAGIAGLHDAIQAGKFGKMKISYGYACKPRAGIGFKEVADPPANLDWDLWRGPACVEKYHANFVHYNWHWFWVTGNGEMNNQGTHELDVARWALDKDQTLPVRVMALGGRFVWKDQGETPNTMFGIAEFPNKQWVYFNVRNVNYKGYKSEVFNEYYFEDGSKITGEGKYMLHPPGGKAPEKLDIPAGKVTPGGNWGAFVAACRAGKPEMANGDILQAHYACALGHLMDNSFRLGEKVPFNAKAGKFGDNKDAAEHFLRLHEIMRDGAGVPEDKENYIVGPWLTFDPKTERHTGDHAEAANKLLRDPNRKGFQVPDADKV
jgi:predicted dehydrogenase